MTGDPVSRPWTNRAIGSPEHEEDEDERDEGHEGAPAGREAALRAVPRLADADLAPEDGLPDDVGEEAGEGDRRQERAEGGDVLGEEPDADLVDSKSPCLEAAEPPAEGRRGHEAGERGDDREPDGRRDVAAHALVTAE